ncbi:hypothetical protein RJT34_01256 [Clitoria ternatea]|uniref:Uncharacterized protein n=1 Tax=Clitoria ternatea TaxID=43366 RepID=A0AAN9KIT0_CLITE
MTGGLLGDKLGLKEEVIKKARDVAFEAHVSNNNKYHVSQWTLTEAYLFISFPGSWDATEWFDNKIFGESKIDLDLLPPLRSVGNDEPALVNQGFLQIFHDIFKNSQIKSEVNKAMVEGKQVVFTGHSSGAAVAILATFWALEEYCNPTKNQKFKAPFCVTFGSPLIGNHIFSHASRREKWSHYFIHFVLRYDIVPRILLAPFSSIEKSFSTILPFFNPHYKPTPQEITIRDNVSSEFYSTVMSRAANVTSHAACVLMGSTNLLLETLTNFVELSPYRPFGTYLFCNGNGQLVVVRNSDAVLQLLFHTAQLRDSTELAEVAKKSIQQHLDYGDELEDSLGMQNVVYLEKLEELPLSADGSNSDVATISTALDGLGLSTRARLCLRAAGELEKQKERNEEKICKEIKDKAVGSMRELESYKTYEIHKGKSYYDAFKVQKEANDFQANVKRLVLAGVWDEVIEMLKRYELPDEFEGNREWIKLGTEFRRLVEPLDIANYYRHLKNEDTGPYMNGARPKRYRYTQRWLEHSNRVVSKGDISESTTWAELEELLSWISNKKPFGEVKERVIKLEQDIKNWTDKGELTKDTFLKDPIFIKWLEILPEDYKATFRASLTVKG